MMVSIPAKAKSMLKSFTPPHTPPTPRQKIQTSDPLGSLIIRFPAVPVQILQNQLARNANDVNQVVAYLVQRGWTPTI